MPLQLTGVNDFVGLHRVENVKFLGTLRNIVSMDAVQFLSMSNPENKAYLLFCRRSLGWGNLTMMYRTNSELLETSSRTGFGVGLCPSEASRALKSLLKKNIIFKRVHAVSKTRFININIPGILKHYLRTVGHTYNSTDFGLSNDEIKAHREGVGKLLSYISNVFETQFHLPTDAQPAVINNEIVANVVSIEEML